MRVDGVVNVAELFRLDGKTALVTGGGRGLGRYSAEALAEAGANVVVCSRTVEACQDVARGVVEQGGRALAVQCDVTRQTDVERVVAATREAFGGVDILVNNSGTAWDAPAENMPLDRFIRVQEVNVTGTFLMAQAAGREMIAQGNGGRIINVASIAGLVGGNPEYVHVVGYAASKGAVIAMTRDLATAWAKHGITVNALAPGWFPTKMSGELLASRGDRMLQDIPLGRFGAPDDLKGAIVFLASAAAAYMTGQTLVVDGGATAR
jgi:NAD(P)-dependent dehydrogenase (short-subunit alcohol dehydrogenase family)